MCKAKKYFPYAAFFCALLLGLYIIITQAFQPELDVVGNRVLGILVIILGLWIFKPFKISLGVSSVLFCALLMVAGLPAGVAFSGFTNTATWTLIPAMFYGYVLAKTGLGKRLAYFFMKMVDISYLSMILMFAIIGTVMSLLTPAIAVRVAIITPIALNCVDLCKLPKHSKGRSLLLLTAWAMVVIPSVGWLSGSLAGVILSGMYAGNEALGAISFAAWTSTCLLPAIVYSVLMVVIAYFFLKPEEKLHISKEIFREEYKKMGTISGKEIFSLVVLAASFVMFTTNSIHKIPDAATCIVGFVLLYASGVLQPSDINTGISWDLILFQGTAMGFSTILATSGVSAWLSSIIVPSIAPFTGNPFIFCIAMIIIFFLLRFIDIAVFIPTFAIISSTAPAIASTYGVDPRIWMALLPMGMNAFFLSYQNVFLLISQASLKEDGWTNKHQVKYATAYFIACLLSMIVAVPYWNSLGIFG